MKKEEIIIAGIFLALTLALSGLSMIASSKKGLVLSLDRHQDTVFTDEEATVEDEEEFELQREDVLEPDRFQALVRALPLELLGTAIGNAKDPIAFIKDLDTGKQGVYRLGSQIKDAQVIQISRGEVIFNRNGEKEILRLSARGVRWAGSQQTSGAISMTGSSVFIDKKALKNEAAKFYKDLKEIKVTPYKQGNKAVGLKVTAVPQGSAIEAAGIRNNDIITMVNGQQVNSYQKALQVAVKARTMSEVNLGLLREGESKVLKYRLK